MALEKTWEAAIRAKFPGAPYVPPTQIERGKLSQIRRKLFDAGVEPNAAVRYIVQYWQLFSYSVFSKFKHQTATVPTIKDLHFTVSYAAKWYHEKSQQPPPNFGKSPQPEKVIKTPEQIAAEKAAREAEKLEQLELLKAEGL